MNRYPAKLRRAIESCSRHPALAPAAIFFTFGALGYIGQIVYTWALDKLEELAINGIVGLVERFLSKGIRALLSPLMNLVKPMLAKVVRSMCSAIPQLAKVGLCVQERFAPLPPKYRWVDRALACKYNAPRITPRMHRRAVAARFEIRREAEGMKEDVIAQMCHWPTAAAGGRRLTSLRERGQFGDVRRRGP